MPDRWYVAKAKPAFVPYKFTGPDQPHPFVYALRNRKSGVRDVLSDEKGVLDLSRQEAGSGEIKRLARVSERGLSRNYSGRSPLPRAMPALAPLRPLPESGSGASCGRRAAFTLRAAVTHSITSSARASREAAQSG